MQTSPPLGILPSPDAEPQVQLSYRVDDIAAAVERVPGGRRPRGRARHAGRSGCLTECVDDQGMTFRLWQPTD